MDLASIIGIILGLGTAVGRALLEGLSRIHTSRFPSNWELSTARATWVLSYLTNQFLFEPSRLSVAGYGEYRPVASNATAESRALNRRADLVILSEAAEKQEPN